jgi:hypothetical protein
MGEGRAVATQIQRCGCDASSVWRCYRAGSYDQRVLHKLKC